MSLTSLLKTNPHMKRLFSCLPPMSDIKKTYQPISSGEYVQRNKMADAALIGVAYDFWLRAYIQRLNKKEVEVKLPIQILGGVSTAIEAGYLNNEKMDVLMENVEAIWKMRSDYINGKMINEDDLLKGCLVLAYCERTLRNKIEPEKGYLEIKRADFLDLKNLAYFTQKIPRAFQTKKSILMNPKFGRSSIKVDGADADYILGNMLVDIKTTQNPLFKKEYLDQLFAYYLLSLNDNTFPCQIKQIGIFIARYNKLEYFEIKDINRKINVERFSEFFWNIVEANGRSFKEVSNKELKQILVL